MTDRNQLSDELHRVTLGHLAAAPAPGWVPLAGLIQYAPEGRETVWTEIDNTRYGFDDPRGPAYDAGPSGKPDGRMLEGVISRLRRELIIEEGYPEGLGRSFRMYDIDGPVGLQEIGERLGVKRATTDTWRQRGVLPEPEQGSVGGRPWWKWRTSATGRSRPGAIRAPLTRRTGTGRTGKIRRLSWTALPVTPSCRTGPRAPPFAGNGETGEPQ